MPSPSSLPSSSMLFSPLSFFHSQKANDRLSTQIIPFPLAHSKPIGQPPHSPTAPSLSISVEVHSLTETIQSLEALLKEQTPTPPSSQPSHLPQPSHPPLPLYHQVDPHLPDPLPFPTSYADEVPSYLLLGWPLPPLPAMFTLHWEQLQNDALHLPPILWNPFQFPLQPHQPQIWMIVPISHKLYPLPSPFPQDLATQAQSFWLDVSHVDLLNTSTPTVPIIVVPSTDKLPLATLTTNALNFVASTVSSMVTPRSSAPKLCLQAMTPSWMPSGTSLTTRSMSKIGVLEMELQDYEGNNVTDVWDPPPFPLFRPLHGPTLYET